MNLIELVELKNGDSVKGFLENTDNFMNLKISDVIYTNKVKINSNKGSKWILENE